MRGYRRIGIYIGFLAGASLVLVFLPPDIREKLRGKILDGSHFVVSQLRTSLERCQSRLAEAIEAGKEEARRRELELQREVLKPEVEEEETPKYIV